MQEYFVCCGDKVNSASGVPHYLGQNHTIYVILSLVNRSGDLFAFNVFSYCTPILSSSVFTATTPANPPHSHNEVVAHNRPLSEDSAGLAHGAACPKAVTTQLMSEDAAPL